VRRPRPEPINGRRLAGSWPLVEAGSSAHPACRILAQISRRINMPTEIVRVHFANAKKCTKAILRFSTAVWYPKFSGCEAIFQAKA
jgi:hypothetical protein